MQDNEATVIQKAKEGDKKAFDCIITEYKSKITDLCYKYMRNKEEAVDMAQETFCQAYVALQGFKGDSKISTWLYRICVNLCINKLDSLKRRHYFTTDSLHEDAATDRPEVQVIDKHMGQDRELEAKELKDIIMEELGSFPEEEKNVLILREMKEFEYDEISEIMKIPVGSVKSKLSRAREKLKEKLMKRLGYK